MLHCVCTLVHVYCSWYESEIIRRMLKMILMKLERLFVLTCTVHKYTQRHAHIPTHAHVHTHIDI